MREDARVVFEPLYDDVRPPARSTAHSAGYDVRAWLRASTVCMNRAGEERDVPVREAHVGGSEDGAAARAPADERPDGNGAPVAAAVRHVVLEPGDRALVPTGFKARLPEGYEAQIRVRSSIAWRKGLVVPNAPGTVDADYPDEWYVLLHNVSGHPQRVSHGERIAQVVLARYAALPWARGAVGVSTDRVGGLGSTGR